MSSGERPIGAAKGKPCDTEALCQPPPPNLPSPNPYISETAFSGRFPKIYTHTPAPKQNESLAQQTKSLETAGKVPR